MRAVYIILLMLVVWFWPVQVSAQPRETIRIVYPVTSPYYAVILRGAQFPVLQGLPVPQVRAFALHDGVFAPIPFQIDRRDEKGVLLLDPELRTALAQDDTFGARDEAVFMAGGLGARQPPDAVFPPAERILELELIDPRTVQAAWVYLIVSDTTAPPPVDAVRYDPGADAIETDTWRLGFSRRVPMLADTLQWFDPATRAWGSDVLDIVKIRHTGRVLGRFEFRRCEEDYQSKLVGTRVGPVRVIRRTENSMHMFLGLRSPTIRVDYIAYPNAMIADTLLDIPFRVDWLISDLDTLTTWDGNDAPGMPPTTAWSRTLPQGFALDGRMTDAERRFNASHDTAFAVVNRYGSLFVTMRFDAGIPAHPQVYVNDDRALPDPPEDVPGQYGNIGFRVSGLERLEAGRYHMAYQVLLVRDVEPVRGRQLIEEAPPFY